MRASLRHRRRYARASASGRAARAPRPMCQPIERQPGEQRAHEGPAEVARVGRADAEAREQVELAGEVELHHVIAPPGVGRVPALQQRQQPRRAVEQPLADGERLRHQIEHAAAQPLRRHHRGRVDARPAASLEPHLRPGVRIGLAHLEELPDRVPLAAEVAGDHARRHAARRASGRRRPRRSDRRSPRGCGTAAHRPRRAPSGCGSSE